MLSGACLGDIITARVILEDGFEAGACLEKLAGTALINKFILEINFPGQADSSDMKTNQRI